MGRLPNLVALSGTVWV